MKRRLLQLVSFASVATAMQACAPQVVNRNANPDRGDSRNAIRDGTYAIRICKKDCASGSHVVAGMLVVDRSRTMFRGASDAMRSFAYEESGIEKPNYCYYFDPAADGVKGTMFEVDVVGFAALMQSPGRHERIAFVVGSPDFRYYADVRSADAEGFVADWSEYAGFGDDPGPQSYPDVALHAVRISDANARGCFETARKYRSGHLKERCQELHREGLAASCEALSDQAAPSPS